MKDILWAFLIKKGEGFDYRYIERDDFRIGLIGLEEKFLTLSHNIILPPEKRELGEALERAGLNVAYMERVEDDAVFQLTLKVAPVKRRVYPYCVFVRQEELPVFINRGGRIRKGKAYKNLRNGREVVVEEIVLGEKTVNSLLSNQVIQLKLSWEKSPSFKKGDVLTKEEVLRTHHHYLARIEGKYEHKGNYYLQACGFRTTATVKRVKEGFVVLSLHNPWLLFWNDVFILKDEAGRVKASGRIVMALEDPEMAGKAVKPKESMLRSEDDYIREMVLQSGLKGIEAYSLVLSTGITLAAVEEILLKLEREGSLKVVSFIPVKAFSAQAIDEAMEKLRKILEKYHEENPASEGMKLAELERRAKLGGRLFPLALQLGLRRGLFHQRKDVIRLSSFKPDVPEFLLQLEEELEEFIKEKSSSAPPTLKEIEESLGRPGFILRQLLEKLVRDERVYRVKDFYFHRDYIEELKAKLSGRERLTIQEFKELTGFSRKYAIPLLEFLDSIAVTERENGTRKVLI